MSAVTIIMRSKDSDWVIDQALAALYSQEFRDFELLVVDSGSKDRTLEMVRRYPHRLIEIPPSNYFPGSVLNMAIENCTSEIIVFVNSDCVLLHPDCLGKLVAQLKSPEVDAAFARQIPRPDAELWVRTDYAKSFPAEPRAPAWMTFSLPLAGFKRSAWKKHPFYTQAWASEDSEWGHWARENGLTVRYLPECRVMHSHNYTAKQLFARKYVEGEADVFIYGRKANPASLVQQIALQTFRDILIALKEASPMAAFSSLGRAVAGQLGYYRGVRLGWRRVHSKNLDLSIGQSVVLKNPGTGP